MSRCWGIILPVQRFRDIDSSYSLLALCLQLLRTFLLQFLAISSSAASISLHTAALKLFIHFFYTSSVTLNRSFCSSMNYFSFLRNTLHTLPLAATAEAQKQRRLGTISTNTSTSLHRTLVCVDTETDCCIQTRDRRPNLRGAAPAMFTVVQLNSN